MCIASQYPRSCSSSITQRDGTETCKRWKTPCSEDKIRRSALSMHILVAYTMRFVRHVLPQVRRRSVLINVGCQYPAGGMCFDIFFRRRTPECKSMQYRASKLLVSEAEGRRARTMYNQRVCRTCALTNVLSAIKTPETRTNYDLAMFRIVLSQWMSERRYSVGT